MEKTLIVVHPGSTCGSADFNLGDIKAAHAREKMSKTIFNWNGHIIVIDGILSSDLENYPLPGLAFENKEDTESVSRTFACSLDDGWEEKALNFIVNKVSLKNEIVITGAWNQDDLRGCINTVEKRLNNFGYNTKISECALIL